MSTKNDLKTKVFNYKNEVERLLTNSRIKNRARELKLTKEQIYNAIPVMIDMFNEPMDSEYLTSFIVARSGSIQRIMIKSEEVKSNSYLENFLTLDTYPLQFGDEVFENNEARKNVVLEFKKIFTDKNPKQGLYIYGPMGIGKTFVSKRFAKKLSENGKTIAFLNVPELVQQMKFNFDKPKNNEKLTKNVQSADFLFLDDIGAEIISPWFRDEFLHNLLNHRMNLNKPTFFTSNYSYDELFKVQSRTSREKYPNKEKAARLLERIKTQSIPVFLDGKNKRY